MPSAKSIIGGAIVSQTLDNLNNGPYSGSGDADSSTSIGAAVVTKTLDKLNSGKRKGALGTQKALSESYNFNKDVLGAVYSGKGGITNIGT